MVKLKCLIAYWTHLVMVGKYGLIRRGASVRPKKMLAEAFIDSAAVVPIVTYSSQPAYSALLTTLLSISYVPSF